jgi:predicted nucleic acid-binding protein
LDDRIATEYEEVLYRPRFDLPHHEVRILLRRIDSLAAHAVVTPHHVVQNLPDPDDAPFAECARALDCALVTGNARHYPKRAMGNIHLLSSRQFCDAISQS